MTLSTQSFFEASDIISIRMTCNGCHASFLLPLDNHGIIFKCPRCPDQWFQSALHLEGLKNFIENIKTLQRDAKADKVTISFGLKRQPENEEQKAISS